VSALRRSAKTSQGLPELRALQRPRSRQDRGVLNRSCALVRAGIEACTSAAGLGLRPEGGAAVFAVRVAGRAAVPVEPPVHGDPREVE